MAAGPAGLHWCPSRLEATLPRGENCSCSTSSSGCTGSAARRHDTDPAAGGGGGGSGAHPTGKGRVGMSSVSLANMAESARRPLARLMSDTCVCGGAAVECCGLQPRQAAHPGCSHTVIASLTVTLYLTASPANVSCLESCSRGWAGHGQPARQAAAAAARPHRTHLVAHKVVVQPLSLRAGGLAAAGGAGGGLRGLDFAHFARRPAAGRREHGGWRRPASQQRIRRLWRQRDRPQEASERVGVC